MKAAVSDLEINSRKWDEICFNALYYAERYPDLKAAYGLDGVKLYHHWITWGRKEGRCASPVFDPVYYLQVNTDVAAIIGANNYEGAYRHFIEHGCMEKRISSECYNGIHYAQANPDLSKMDGYSLAHHYIQFGISEKRTANPNGKQPGKVGPFGVPSDLVEDGCYMFISGNSSNRVLDIAANSRDNGGNLTTYEKKDKENQKFDVSYLGNGYYSIRGLRSGKYLHIEHFGSATTNVHQWDGCGHSNAQWVLKAAGDGYYYIQNRGNEGYLDNDHGSTALGNNVIACRYNGSQNQKWKLVPCDRNLDEEESSFQWPLSNYFVCGNGWSEYYSAKKKDHLGMDIKSSSGNTDVYAAGAGTVAQTGYNSANGNTVTIKHEISGRTVYSFYAHLNSVKVSAGEKVSKGQKIGVIGNTGSSSTGVHLHFAFTTQCSAGTWGYGTSFNNSKNSTNYQGYTFYNPAYVIEHNSLP